LANRPTAVLFDPYPLWLRAAATHLESAGWQIVAATTSLDEALACIAKRAPDAAVLALGDEDEPRGFENLGRVLARAPRTRAIVVSRSDDPADAERAFAAGAAAYVVRTAEPEDLHAAMRQALDQSVFLAAPSAGPTPGNLRLTERERQILRLVAEGKSNREVARALWLTEPTVKVHLSRIYRKLGVSNRTEAGRWALANGLLVGPRRGARTS
jgi:DNA-binding NarL/FixJ family response regulator